MDLTGAGHTNNSISCIMLSQQDMEEAKRLINQELASPFIYIPADNSVDCKIFCYFSFCHSLLKMKISHVLEFRFELLSNFRLEYGDGQVRTYKRIRKLDDSGSDFLWNQCLISLSADEMTIS